MFTVILLDIDDFKAVNDRFGHLAGDEVIRALGTILRRQLRPSDLACRYGGDEFAIFVPHSSVAGAEVVADRICEAVGGLRLADHPDLGCTASLGVAAMGPQTGSLQEAIAQADRALYRAKAGGRNRASTGS